MAVRVQMSHTGLRLTTWLGWVAVLGAAMTVATPAPSVREVEKLSLGERMQHLEEESSRMGVEILQLGRENLELRQSNYELQRKNEENAEKNAELEQRLSTEKADILARLSDQTASASEAVYVRWGNSSCGGQSSKVYSGTVGGGYFQHTGAAVNALCLPPTLEYDGQQPTTSNAPLYGAEYETHPGPRYELDVVCAVCVAPRSAVAMVPGRMTCPGGWSREYSGYLMAGGHTHAAATEYICVDAAREADPASHYNHNGKLLYFVVGQCGSLNCPPFQHDKVVTCVVCSK